MTWAATQAKAKFSEVLDCAETEGPQIVRRRKREFVVMTREAHDAAVKAVGEGKPPVGAWDALQPSFKDRYDIDFQRAVNGGQKSNAQSKQKAPEKHENLAEFFRHSPLAKSGIKLERLKMKPRHVEL